MEQELTADEDITRYSLFKSVAIVNIWAVLSFRFCLRSRILFKTLWVILCVEFWCGFWRLSRISGPSVAGLETTYSGGNGFSTSYNSQRWLNLYLSACKLLDLALALPSESLPQFQMWVSLHVFTHWMFEMYFSTRQQYFLLKGNGIAVSFVYTKLTCAVQSVQVDSQDCFFFYSV